MICPRSGLSMILCIFLIALLLGFTAGCTSTPASRLESEAAAEQEQQRQFLAETAGDADEIWIVERTSLRSRRGAPSHLPRAGDADHVFRHAGGAMVAYLSGDEDMVVVPLPHKRTAVHASISGSLATVHLAQQFHNEHPSTIDAIYTFLLPHDAAITEFLLTIGNRRIRGIIRERDQARELYREAQRQRYTASLLMLDDSGMLTQSVANIAPGQSIEIDLRYFQPLHVEGSTYEFTFPIGGTFSRRDDNGAGVIAIVVDIEAMGPVLDIHSNYTALVKRSANHGQTTVALTTMQTEHTEPHQDTDFILRFRAERPRPAAINAGRSPFTDPLEIMSNPQQLDRLARQLGILSPGNAYIAVDTLSRAADDEVRIVPTKR